MSWYRGGSQGSVQLWPVGLVHTSYITVVSHRKFSLGEVFDSFVVITFSIPGGEKDETDCTCLPWVTMSGLVTHYGTHENNKDKLWLSWAKLKFSLSYSFINFKLTFKNFSGVGLEQKM